MTDILRTQPELIAENALLHQQIIVLQRSVKRPIFRKQDKLLLIGLASKLQNWTRTLVILQPDTLLRWHRELFRWIWRRKSKPKKAKRTLPMETIALILQMVRENGLWGAERIRGELLKLGIKVSKRTVQRYLRHERRPRPRGQSWQTFLHNHASHVWACDFVQTYDVFFRAIFVFVIIEHSSRRVAHYGVTRTPSDRWVAQHLREATPFGDAPKYLIRDNDAKYGRRFSRLAQSSGIEELCIPYNSPNCNALSERFIGSLRRECLDPLLIVNETQLHRRVKEHVAYFNQARPHQGIAQQIPAPKAEPSSTPLLKIVAQPVLGGLHHNYHRVA